MPGNSVVGKDVVLIGQDFLADYLGVTSQAISNWYSRDLSGMPAAMYVHYRPGKTPTRIWRTAQLPAWDRWMDKHKAQSGHHTPVRSRKAATKAVKAA